MNERIKYKLAWIEIKGIPACLWDNHVFNRIGERFGRLVKKSEASMNDGNLFLEKLVILVSHGNKILEEICVRWNKCIIKVWVHEFEENWTPTFLDNVDKEEEDIDVPFSVAGMMTGEGEEKSQNTKSCMGKMHESGVHGKGGKDADIETSPPRLDDPALEVGPTADNLMSRGELSNGPVVYAFGAQEKSDKDGPVENVLRKKRNSGSSTAQRIRVPRVPDLNVYADDLFNLDKIISAFGAKRNAKRKRRSPDRLNSFSKSEGDPVKKLKEGGLEEVSPELSTESGDANGRSSSPPFVDVEVENEVKETMAVGIKAFGVKLAYLKKGIREWRGNQKSGDLKCLAEWNKEVDRLERLGECRPLSSVERGTRANLRSKIKSLATQEALDLQQKARINWIKYGDENSAFFHRCCKVNMSRNRISGLSFDGVWETDPEGF
ncbi:hypothetical protein L1987_35405 [Smallanthus sonchifolius]|uniref:Uncharacterized protein n=1 Tax=Smallanthus sonchifolius TaxID=185202 RepID=A0ACB9HZ54_9ASTR|nr:hypothetical protein L1987_35405 [Smallanthus sonchifolius]